MWIQTDRGDCSVTPRGQTSCISASTSKEKSDCQIFIYSFVKMLEIQQGGEYFSFSHNHATLCKTTLYCAFL